MTFLPEKHYRHSIRLKGYDYTQAGAYFVTICTQNRECLFGEVLEGEMRLNEYGRIAQATRDDLPHHYANAALDTFVVMPNHVHGIVMITDGPHGPNVGAGSPRPISLGAGTAPLHEGAIRPMGAGTTPLLGQIVAYFKYQSTVSINRLRGTPRTPVWQRNYYEHIIRDEDEFSRIQEYIANNPLQWAVDRENPSIRARPAVPLQHP